MDSYVALVSHLGPVHTSHFCRIEFNSIKCGRNATVDSYVALVSHLIQNLHCRVCRPAENVLSVDYSIWRTIFRKIKVLRRSVFSSAILSTLRLKHFPLADIPDSINSELSATQVRRMNPQSYFCRVEFNSTNSIRQKFDVWIGYRISAARSTVLSHYPTEMRHRFRRRISAVSNLMHTLC